MPLFKSSMLAQWLDGPLGPNERSMLLAISALVVTFLCGRSESIIGNRQWDTVARFCIAKSLSVRSEYDFVLDSSVSTLLASFFIAIAYFELHDSHHTWFYLREAITLAQALGLHTSKYYDGMNSADALYSRRIYDILFVTERSFAIARHKPVLLLRPLDPSQGVSGEEHENTSEIDVGFRQLVRVYSQLEVEFLDVWSQQGSVNQGLARRHGRLELSQECDALAEIQKADILVTQHWLELVFWTAALQQSELSSTAVSRSKSFYYPEDLASSLLCVTASLSVKSIEIHGLGMFEKIYDVGNALADLMDCSTTITGSMHDMAQNLDRLRAVCQLLSLTPNSYLKFAVPLGRRVAEAFDHSYCSAHNTLPITYITDQCEASEQEIEATS
ncbi:hypothetical protein D6D17_05497 [Aureobasidium pullulans]|nr:hypothetical protein D6D17_05497 [Aureobasidium pullulans]THY48835.1 hypothetical protein D6C99_05339 [Aureobasidium pullulans]